MSKKVYFYKVELNNGGMACDYRDIPAIIQEIVNNNAIASANYKSLDASLEIGNPLHVILDVFEYEHSRLFARMAKQKPNGSMIQRDYKTYEAGQVLPTHSESKMGIEAYTHCLLDYQTGILAVVSNMGAPNEKAICNLFLKYANNYQLELIDIPNPNGIEELYCDEQSEISRIEVEIPVPNIDALQALFKWNDNSIVDILSEKKVKTVVAIAAQRRKGISDDTEETKTFIDCIKRALPNYTKAKMKAKTKTVKAKDYDFFSSNFSYPIEIPSYHIEGGERVYYDIDELKDFYKANLIEAFNSNRRTLTVVADRVI